ncbi:MAG: acetolactate synthase large subunit, partial [Nitrospinaceae bacterium]|nr:acetolactate synthase large subunit [Nitrospinaceae bacterium]NIR54933.1 acetolactate synthase large subunit [Nitrospinaceae bacterium]NIS85361.1 acetolactate synthase large subunit [Nitrospinaceae bacterium]NIT82175.1 acetolactate synthase large subunit [Nitrospinaceae bacterium]NIU44429.1 acetolactate synthase large subunit [Nitrospinaceae bacterium]
MKASDLFIRSLEQEGVKYVFGLPGEETLDLLESLNHSRIRFILTRHEQAAGFMAATYGRLTGKVGVCLTTLGPGATNLVTAVAFAQLGAMPLLAITGQKPVKKSKQGRFQMVDVVEMMRPLTKFTKQVVNGRNIPILVREVVRIAQEERPGAVHLELPEDVASEDTVAPSFEMMKSRRPNADDQTLRRAAKMIRQAKRPLLLIGAAANRARTSTALRKFIDKTGIYFFNTQMGKGVVDERHRRFLGTAALSQNDYVHCAIDRADLILNVGHDVIEKPPFFMQEGGTRVIHINHFPAVLDAVYFPQLDVVGDIANTIEALTQKVENNPNWDFSYFKAVKREFEKHIKANADDGRHPVIPQRLVAAVRRVMPPTGIIALDNGIYKIWFARNYKAYHTNTVLLDNALAAMGAGLPAAMAAKMVFPKKKVLAVCGDGGFMMTSEELETAVRLGLNLCILVVRDNAYGMVKWKQVALGHKQRGLDYDNPDFVKYAESYGAIGHRLEKTDDLEPMLRDCLESPGVHLVDLPVDYSENHRVFDEELPQIT